MTQVPSPLNVGQQAAADGFFQFLFQSQQSELIISGPGGVGKTFLMGHLIDQILPQYFDTCKIMGIKPEYDEVVMTATTNKAAEVLGRSTGRITQTIHSFLHLTVKDDYSTGRSELKKTNEWVVHTKKIIFVDEASMIDSPLLRCLREGTHQCKIIFVGDHCQLAPVMEPISPIYNQNLPFFELTEPMRNNGQPALMGVCSQLRATVETGLFLPIQVVPGVIDYFDSSEMEKAIEDNFKNQNPDARILAYTNARVVDYNDHVREVRQLSSTYTEGEVLINNSAIRLSKEMLSVEEEVEILRINPTTDFVDLGEGTELEIRLADLKSTYGIYKNVRLPENKAHFAELLKYYSGRKQWSKYFNLKNYFPDLRPRDAATVHKAQGSTYDTVFIDMGNISTCRNADVAARMLYVGFTRPRSRIVMYGQLAEKFGGIVQ